MNRTNKGLTPEVQRSIISIVMLTPTLLLKINGEVHPVDTAEKRAFALGLILSSSSLPSFLMPSGTVVEEDVVVKPPASIETSSTPPVVDRINTKDAGGTRSAETPLFLDLGEDDLLKGHKPKGERAIDYAHKVGQSLIGRKFNLRSLADFMLQAGWPTTAKDEKIRVSSVRTAIKDAPQFVELGNGIYEYKNGDEEQGSSPPEENA